MFGFIRFADIIVGKHHVLIVNVYTCNRVDVVRKIIISREQISLYLYLIFEAE